MWAMSEWVTGHVRDESFQTQTDKHYGFKPVINRKIEYSVPIYNKPTQDNKNTNP